MRIRAFLLAVVLVALVSVGVVHAAKVYRSERLEGIPGGRVLLLPVEVRIFELDAHGRLVRHNGWTSAAGEAVVKALREELQARNLTPILLRQPAALDRREQYEQLARLHGLVLNTILTNYVDKTRRLPSKGDRFDWTLGTDAAMLSRDHDDVAFAMWTSFGDAFSTGGRQAMNVAGAILGAEIVTGRQVCIASLIDLRTGDIVWLARRVVSGTGAADLRTLDGARHAVRDLFEQLPQ